jgi:hypothetical protein
MTLFWICLVAVLVVFGIDAHQKRQKGNDDLIRHYKSLTKR